MKRRSRDAEFEGRRNGWWVGLVYSLPNLGNSFLSFATFR